MVSARLADGAQGGDEARRLVTELADLGRPSVRAAACVVAQKRTCTSINALNILSADHNLLFFALGMATTPPVRISK